MPVAEPKAPDLALRNACSMIGGHDRISCWGGAGSLPPPGARAVPSKPAEDVAHLSGLLAREAPKAEVEAAVHAVRMRLNPQPAGSWS
jgi:hypothetical protein